MTHARDTSLVCSTVGGSSTRRIAGRDKSSEAVADGVFDEGVELAQHGHHEESSSGQGGHDGAGGPEAGSGEPAAGVEGGPDGAVAGDLFAQGGAEADFFVASPDHDGEDEHAAQRVEDGAGWDEVGPEPVFGRSS